MPGRTPSQLAALERSAAVHHRVLADPRRHRVLTGDRPTGPLHVGHYLGTLANRVRLQNLGVEVFVLIADYQVMTDQLAGQQLAATVRGVVADYLAAGIDPHRSTIFTHSAVPALNELVLPFLSLVSAAELHRNPTVKAETRASGRPPTGLMLTYPVHQAADILFCHANLVPVGLDQLPHLETTRLIARRFNERYAQHERLFPEPDALLTGTPMLAGLDGTKMSKTRGNAIALSATEDETAAMIRHAPTDSQRHISYDPAGRPAVASLVHHCVRGAGRSAARRRPPVTRSGGRATRRLRPAAGRPPGTRTVRTIAAASTGSVAGRSPPRDTWPRYARRNRAAGSPRPATPARDWDHPR
jgi:tryptophanyl-tRNA synthetase